MRIIVIIPARGGSKGLPNKNLAIICGSSLISWSISDALSVTDHVYVTSDSSDILNESKLRNAKTIKRPDSLSTDRSCTDDALRHAIDIIGINNDDIVVLLQATSPLRLSYDLRNALKQFDADGLDSLFSAICVDDLCLWQKNGSGLHAVSYDYKNRLMRQDRNHQYIENGSIYIFKPSVIRKGNRLGGKIGTYLMKPFQIFEVDDEKDLKLCEFLMGYKNHFEENHE